MSEAASVSRRPCRRDLLKAGAAGLLAAALPGASPSTRNRLGLVIHSFPVRSASDRSLRPEDRLSDPIRFLEHGRSLNARGVQVAIGTRDDAYCDKLRNLAQAASMDLEGIVTLPRDEADLARFEAEIQTARKAGATIARTALLNGRRYETYDSLATFRQAKERASNSLKLAAPIAVRLGVRLAVENHKDLRSEELVALLKAVGSDHVGACVDTGNSLALLEDPMETVETLAPWAITTHFKDMGVEEYDRGFRIAEVPLGEGVLDLPAMIRTLRSAHPEIPFNLEMITRDPLEIPCLTERYWTTFPELPASDLARALRDVRSLATEKPLPKVARLNEVERLKVEDANILRSLAYAQGHL